MNSTVEEWLRSLNLVAYTQAFLDNGYDELDICKEIGEEDLDAIGVLNRRDRGDILNAVDRLKTGGTAVYFVLEQCDEPKPSPVQLRRESFEPLKLRLLLHAKLEEDKINLAVSPYTNADGSRGKLEALAKYYSDKLYAYEEEVLKALESLRDRQAGQSNYGDLASTAMSDDSASDRSLQASPSHKGKHHPSESQEEEKPRQATRDHGNSKMQPAGQVKPGSPLDNLGVDHDSGQGKKEKRRRRVERNTKLSRSLDSLKELHVNAEPKLRDREPSSFRLLKIFHHGKKKPNVGTSCKNPSLETHPNVNLSIQASNITMSEEDRMALMIMVKQGELTTEQALEQFQSYEEDHAKEKTDKGAEEDKHSKSKLKRGIWSKGSKRKSASRPGSEIIASEMTMGEEDRINLMKLVKNGEMTMDEAVRRLESYEGKHKGIEEVAANKDKQWKPRSPKTRGNFAKKSIRRVSSALSSSFRLPSRDYESGSVFYTNSEGNDEFETSSQERSAESSPDSSPFLAQPVSQVRDSLRKEGRSASTPTSTESTPSTPTFISEIKIAVARHSGEHKAPTEQRRGSEDQPKEVVHPTLKAVPLCNKYEKPPPPKPGRKESSATDEPSPPNPSAVPRVPPRQGTIKVRQDSGGESDASTRVLPPAEPNDAKTAGAKKLPPLPPRPASRKSVDSQPSAPTSDAGMQPSPQESARKPSPPSKPAVPQNRPSAETAAPAKPPAKPKPKPKPRIVPKPSESSADSGTGNLPTARDSPELVVPKPQAAPEEDHRKNPREPERPKPASREAPPRRPVPRQRHSPSLGEVIERRLQSDGIDLTLPPYSNEDGRWGVPYHLVDRYAEEMNRPITEIADCVEVIRRRNLNKSGRQVVPHDVSTVAAGPRDEVQVHSLEAWLTSLGLPKYINSFIDVDYADMEMMPYMTEKHFAYVVFDPRHMRRLLAAVEDLRRSSEFPTSPISPTSPGIRDSAL